MKTFKLKGLDYYIVNVFSIGEAVLVAWSNNWGIVDENLEETDYNVDREFGYAVACKSKKQFEAYLN